MQHPYQTLALLNVDLKTLHGLPLNDLLSLTSHLHPQPASDFLHNHVVYNFTSSFLFAFPFFLLECTS